MSVVDPFLWTGTTFAVFHFVGNFHVFNDKFSIKSIDLPITVANSFSNLPDIQSSPTVLFTGRECSSFNTKQGLTFESDKFGHMAVYRELVIKNIQCGILFSDMFKDDLTLRRTPPPSLCEQCFTRHSYPSGS